MKNILNSSSLKKLNNKHNPSVWAQTKTRIWV